MGKQWAGGERPFGFIFYTPTSGIWQVFWSYRRSSVVKDSTWTKLFRLFGWRGFLSITSLRYPSSCNLRGAEEVPIGTFSDPFFFREVVEVAVKQKGSEDVTVSLFEGENGPQVIWINKYSACQTHIALLEWGILRTVVFFHRWARRLEGQEMWSHSSWKILVSGLLTIPSSTRCRQKDKNFFWDISGQVGLSSGDEVNSYAGLRTIQLAKEGEKKIILLNGKSLDFQVVTMPCLNLFNIHLLLLIWTLDHNFFLFLYPVQNMIMWPDPSWNLLRTDTNNCFIHATLLNLEYLECKLCDKQVGPLDQGYWPDGLLTPPSEEAIRHSRFFPMLKHPN